MLLSSAWVEEQVNRSSALPAQLIETYFIVQRTMRSAKIINVLIEPSNSKLEFIVKFLFIILYFK
jgi:hypothetical protein